MMTDSKPYIKMTVKPSAKIGDEGKKPLGQTRGIILLVWGIMMLL
jgi:hypothetical protein